MKESEKIVIIEGPPPEFEYLNDAWLLGLTEGPIPGRVARTRLRTFNGIELAERCHKAWRKGEPIFLEYRGEAGITEQSSIVAARWLEAPEGDMLLLWVRQEEEGLEFELDYELEDHEEEFGDEFSDEFGDDFEDDFFGADLDHSA